MAAEASAISASVAPCSASFVRVAVVVMVLVFMRFAMGLRCVRSRWGSADTEGRKPEEGKASVAGGPKKARTSVPRGLARKEADASGDKIEILCVWV